VDNAPNVAHHDALNEFDYVWCVKGLIATRSIMVEAWKVRLKVSIIF
jgi:hypothetical protein